MSENSYLDNLRAKVRLENPVYLAPGAQVFGDVQIGANSSVWFNAVIRADNDYVRIGAGTNIQDLAMIHVDPGAPVRIGNGVTVGHSAIVHGCTIGDNCLIGMRSTIMNHAVIGQYCVIGAHALITEGMIIPDFSIVMGMPGKIIRQTDESMQQRIRNNALAYVNKMKEYLGR